MTASSTCVSCGCTNLRTCPGGCSWLGVNHRDGTGVCSSCPGALTAWRGEQALKAYPAASDAQMRIEAGVYPAGGRIQIGPTDI